MRKAQYAQAPEQSLKGGGPRRFTANAGLPVQLRFQTGHTGAEYVTGELWGQASLAHCLLHTRGGCGFARHGTYARVEPPGTLIARWYCPQGHCTFSLLPDHLAGRLRGTLAQVEAVVLAVERARSVEAAADQLRPDGVSLPSALRWVRRRLGPVRALLQTVVAMFAPQLEGCAPSISGLRQRLGRTDVLMHLRSMAGAHLGALITPPGFRRRSRTGGERARALQQSLGPDPPIEPR